MNRFKVDAVVRDLRREPFPSAMVGIEKISKKTPAQTFAVGSFVAAAA